MSKTKWDGKVPFIKGKPQTYVVGNEAGLEWRENTPFEDTLVFDRFTRGMSAARACFRSKKLKGPVEMFLTDLADVMHHLNDGMLMGTFRFAKRGMNYAVQYVKTSKAPPAKTKEG